MYKLYPSNQKLQFDKLSYNDIVLSPKDFSIENLVKDTDFKPTMSYEEAVKELYLSLL